jgi:hypothetical protein
MTVASEPRRFPFFTAVLVVACAALSVLVFVLSRQNRELKADLTAIEGAIQRSKDALKPGQKLAPLTARNTAGMDVVVPLDAPGRRLVLIGSTQCPACASAKPYWVELSELAVPVNVGTLCLLTDGPGTAEDEAALSMPVLGVRGFPQSSIAKLPTVPVVLLVRDGVVERMWAGPYDVATRDEIKLAMGRG